MSITNDQESPKLSVEKMDMIPEHGPEMKTQTLVPTDRLLCMIINGAIGDQYGAPIEMMPCDSVLTKYGRSIDTYLETSKIADKPYTYTDDTQMSVCTIHLLSENKDVDLDTLTETQLMDHHLKYFEPSRGYSMSTYKIMYAYLTEKKIKIPAQSEHKTTNGGLMRISPLIVRALRLGSLDVDSSEHDANKSELMKMIRVIHYPTHMNPIAVHTSYIFLKFLRFLHTINTNDAEHKASPSALQSQIVQYIKLQLIPDCKENEKLSEMLNVIVTRIGDGTDEYVVMDDNLIGLDGIECYETLSCAIWGLLNHLDRPDKILSHVITYGGDCDTIAGVTGQISGILFGTDAINPAWFQTLENKDMLINIGTTLINHYSNTVARS